MGALLWQGQTHRSISADEGVGYWSPSVFCPPGQVICGFRIRLEKWLGDSGDDTAMNDIEMQCCDDVSNFYTPIGARHYCQVLGSVCNAATGLQQPLQDLGGTASCIPYCKACQGDCDSDSDCADGLRCFFRDSSSTLVPGCYAGGAGDIGTHDYCYDPATP